MENNTFKSSLIGGFRRKDVIDYIEKSTSKSNERISELEAAEDRLAKENEALRGELDSVTGARDRLSEALHDNFDKQEALSASLNAANEELGELRAQLATLTEERDALRAEVDSLRTQAAEFHSFKEGLADLELKAQRRAEDCEAEAKQRADSYEASVRQRTEAYDAETRRGADSYAAEVRQTAEDYMSETKQCADDYESEVRRRVDAYDTETHARLGEMVADCRAKCDRVMQALDTACKGLSENLSHSMEMVRQMPDVLRGLRSDLEELEEQAR